MKKLSIFKHRMNKIEDFSSLEPGWGVELDFRSDINSKGLLHITHDSWSPALHFETWLDAYLKLKNPGGLILNTKEDGLEARIIEILESRQFENYFFIDTTLPTLVKWTIQNKHKKFAVRLSHYEPPEFVESFKGRAEWLWVDCFFGKPVDPEWLLELQGDFKICLVSPELHGPENLNLISDFKNLFASYADAVCTKRPDLWLNPS